MEVRVSRIISEYYDYTRKESDELIRARRVKKNGEIITLGEKASVNDIIQLDDVTIPLKGIFRKIQREKAKEDNQVFSSFRKEDSFTTSSYEPRKNKKSNNPKRESFRKKGKNSEAPTSKYSKRRGSKYGDEFFDDF